MCVPVYQAHDTRAVIIARRKVIKCIRFALKLCLGVELLELGAAGCDDGGDDFLTIRRHDA